MIRKNAVALLIGHCRPQQAGRERARERETDGHMLTVSCSNRHAVNSDGALESMQHLLCVSQLHRARALHIL